MVNSERGIIFKLQSNNLSKSKKSNNLSRSNNLKNLNKWSHYKKVIKHQISPE